MNGWTEPQQQIDARTMRRTLNEDARNLYLRQTAEADADALNDCILAAEIADEQEQQAAEAAEIIDWLSDVYATCPQCKTGYDTRFTNCLRCGVELIQPIVQLPQSPNARAPFPQDAEFGSDEWYNKIKSIEF